MAREHDGGILPAVLPVSHNMKNLLLTFALLMQKQDYYYCSGYISQVHRNQKTRRPCRYWMINYEQMWFQKMIARKDKPISQKLWKNEFRMLPSTSDFIVNLVEADMRKEEPISEKLLAFRNQLLVPYGDYQLEIHAGLFLRILV